MQEIILDDIPDLSAKEINGNFNSKLPCNGGDALHVIALVKDTNELVGKVNQSTHTVNLFVEGVR
ncbi:hypothetical protein [Rhodoferax lacus]|uniref:hypothetical protein n=1 Tax=Rhodoferax lacus TaxID=2184758 RepID=UPI0011C17119|nr:hypothetical protein [Rhodoferax lacus]